jgi:hypothetical protein
MPNKRKLIDPMEIGSKGGRARAESLSILELPESGRCTVKARWDAYHRLDPEKLQAKKDREAKKAKAAEPRPQCPNRRPSGRSSGMTVIVRIIRFEPEPANRVLS